ncbi:hypothetical protein DPMN_141294 [Dreissena polymorpha]|uniref:Uncharacterized protein n=1 Tax=Dreissena polymorpha TaxID=45954 RepID=A0A9D4JL52_DREPO|nr:hypothetical protein DPMN_141294 [Dreissena polymorpha]
MFVDLLVSKGSIVVLPYPISADGVDPDYPEVIITTMSRIVATVTANTNNSQIFL